MLSSARQGVQLFLRADGDENVSRVHDGVRRRIGDETSVAVAHRQQQCARAVTHPRLAHREPGEGRVGGYLDLFEPQLRAPVVHDDVEKLGDVGAK